MTHCNFPRSGRRHSSNRATGRAIRQAKRRNCKGRVRRGVAPKGTTNEREKAPQHQPERNLTVQNLTIATAHPVPHHNGFNCSKPTSNSGPFDQIRIFPLSKRLPLTIAFTAIRAIKVPTNLPTNAGLGRTPAATEHRANAASSVRKNVTTPAETPTPLQLATRLLVVSEGADLCCR